MASPNSPVDLTATTTRLGGKESSRSAPRPTFADDAALLLTPSRGRLDKYRPSNDGWPPVRRTTSLPPRCGDHYSFSANWPPPEPPRCDFGRRVDVFPPRDAPLHVHIQAYALRWGTWTAEIKDQEIRQQVLNTVATKMREAWETAIGDQYYVRPVQPPDDPEQRDEAEETVKKGRKRAVDLSKQPAGFTYEGRDALAVTNGELAAHQLTMEVIQRRVAEKDFDAGEEILDEVLTSLDRDRLVVKDWSACGSHGAVHNRNLLMYSLFVVLECRKERRKLNKLLASFTKESQKKNTRARIEMHQEREFQHLALAAELDLARRDQNSQKSHSDEDNETSDESDTSQPIPQRATKPTSPQPATNISPRHLIVAKTPSEAKNSVVRSTQGERMHQKSQGFTRAKGTSGTSAHSTPSKVPQSAKVKTPVAACGHEPLNGNQSGTQHSVSRPADQQTPKRGQKRANSAFHSPGDGESQSSGEPKRHRKN